jgi:hypothetical protein
MHEESSAPPFLPPRSSPSGCAPSGARDFARFLYNHNPFYVISSALVLYGLRVSFLGGAAFQTRALIVGLMSFVLVLAGTAWLIIRLGSVWNDARTILLMIVLLFVAISVACDLSLAGFDLGKARDLKSGFENFLGSYLFAFTVSEGLLLALGIRLRFWYRLSYHLFLALYFLYPLAVLPLLVQSWNKHLPWALFGFSLATSLAVLTLLPAVRRGADYVKHNGTPWRWPFFPWSLFVILGVAAGLRHYYLCFSFHTVPGLASLFRPYFLVPPLLAVNLLLIEAALISGRRLTRVVALAMPLLLLALAAYQPAATFWQRQFLKQFSTMLGGEPLFVTLFACIVLYAVAAARRLPGAVDCLALSVAALAVAALAVVRPAAHLSDLADPYPLPIAACGLILFLPALVRRSSARAFVVACLMIASLTIEQRQSWLVEGFGIVPWHLLLAVVLVLGSLPNDRFAKVLQELGAAMLCVPAIAWTAWLPDWEQRVGDGPRSLFWSFGYPLAAAGLAAVYGRFVDNKRYFGAAAINLVLWSGVVGQRAYVLARQFLAGLDYLLLGALSFLIAALTSLLKTGLPQRWWARYYLKRPL